MKVIMKKKLIMFAFGAMVLGANAQVKVLSNGNVGVGRGTPSYKLDILGTARFSISGGGWEDIYIDGNNQWGTPQLYCKTLNFRIGTEVYPVNEAHFKWLKYWNIHNLSDERLKENIKPLGSTLSKLLRIEGKSYTYKKNAETSIIPHFEKMSEKEKFGFIAQDLEKIFPELVLVPSSVNEYYAIDYVGMVPVLVEAIKEQQSIIDNLQQEMETLRAALVACCNSKSQKSMQEFNLTNPKNDNVEELKVYQNAPNPFNESTIISCYIPETIKKAELCIYDISGSRLKCLTVTDRGTATIQIQAGQLAAGVYTYLLIGDGKNSEAKQMILTK